MNVTEVFRHIGPDPSVLYNGGSPWWHPGVIEPEERLINAGEELPNSKGFIALIGGTSRLESETGKGSTLFLTFPFRADEVAVRAEPACPGFPKKRAYGKILVAEDDWISFHYLNKILVKSCNTVIHAENGEQAIDIVRNTPDIDLIFMDIRMPVMDGIEATKQIKQIRPDLPIIAQTAYDFSDEKNKILSCGCDEYLAKPLALDKLNELVNKYLD